MEAAMRSEEEMMHLILQVAKDDERVRAVYLNGSRTNPNAPKDRFQDYDVVYVVTDTKPYYEKHDWINHFGTVLYMQMPEYMDLLLEKEYTPQTEQEFKGFLESIGDSIVVVSDEDVVKVHVHTNDPGKAISRALTYGSLTRIKIDNMREEHQEKLIKDAAKVAEQQKFEEEDQS